MAYKTYDLDTLTLQRLDMDTSDANRTAYYKQFLQSYNEAYAKICTERLYVQNEETVTLSSDKRFALTVPPLAKKTQRGYVMWVRSATSYTSSTSWRLATSLEFHYELSASLVETVVVPGATAAGTVYVKYRYIPDELTNPTPTTASTGSTPSLLPDWLQPVLADFAAADYWRTQRKFERMQVWQDAFEQAISALQPPAETLEEFYDVSTINAYSLDTLALNACGLDAANASVRVRFAPLFLAEYNQAYTSLCADYIKPTRAQSVTLSASKTFDLSTLTSPPTTDGIEAVANSDGTTEYQFFYDDTDTIAVPDAEAAGTVSVKYQYVPTAMVNPAPATGVGATAPALLPAQYQSALYYKAAAAYWRMQGDVNRERAMDRAFDIAVSTLRQRRDSASNTVRSVYGYN